MVHLNDGFTLLGVRTGRRVFHEFHRIVSRNDFSEFEERRLQNGVGAVAQTKTLRNVGCIDGVELDVVFRDSAFHRRRQTRIEFFVGPRAVEQEDTALVHVANHIVFVDVRRVVASHEVRFVDKVGRFDRFFTETQVRDGDTAGFLRVIGEVTLCIHIGMVTDDFDRVFVRTDGTVRTQTPEFAGTGAFRRGVDVFFHRKRGVGHVVFDTDGETFFRAFLFHVAIHGNDLTRVGVFRTQAVTARVHRHVREFAVTQRSANIEVQRFADRTRFFGTVENTDLLHGVRESCDQVFDRERAIQTNFDQTDRFAGRIQMIHGFFDGFADRTHRDDDVFRVTFAVVVEQFVFRADLFVDLIHIIFNNRRQRIVVGVRRFFVLEEDVGVLRGTALHRMFRVQRVATERFDSVFVQHFVKIFIIPHFDLLNFVRSTETVEEMQERHATFDGRQVCHSTEVHHFLNTRSAEHCITGLTARIHVGMVTEDRKRMSRERTSRNVDNVRQQFAGDLVHIRDHQQQTLRSGVGGGQRTSRQRTVDRTRSTGFGLHFREFDRATEQVFLTLSRPHIRDFRHYRRRGNGVDSSNVGKRIRYICGSVVTIHRFKLSCHNLFPPCKMKIKVFLHHPI